MFLLWDGEEPVGICLFVAPSKSLRQRNRFFNLSGRWNRTMLRALNCQLTVLSRVVLHPAYRGAGVARRFIRRCCELCPFPWIETLTEMGRFNPVFERAGFIRVGASEPARRSRKAHSSLYSRRRTHGQAPALLTEETYEKSEHSRPIYYIFDNRKNVGRKEEDRPDSGRRTE